MNADDAVWDLLVLGSGMAGLAAATTALQGGARVLLVEKAPYLGGSTAYAGIVWSAPTFDVMREENPDGDAGWAEAITTEVWPAIDWLESLGVPCDPPMPLMRFGQGRRVDTNQLIRICADLLQGHASAEVEVAARTEGLLVEGGAVVGAEIVGAGGVARRVRARNTLLATGGFQADPGMRAQLIHPHARDIPLRSNTHSCGDGLRLAEAAGARFGRPGAGFYGHLIPFGIAYDDPGRFTELTLYCSEHMLLFNRVGERFCDETRGDHLNTLAVLAQPGARALAVADQRVYEEWMVTAFVSGSAPVDKFDVTYRAGGRCARAESLDDFEFLPEEWGYDGGAVRRGIEGFNRDMAAGGPDPDRRYDAGTLERAPWYVVEVGPAITFTYGGILIDTDARALDGAGAPIPGLLAAGADAGGIYYDAYAGGLAAALVTGRRAGRTALAATRDP